jgi:hypothetical protein
MQEAPSVQTALLLSVDGLALMRDAESVCTVLLRNKCVVILSVSMRLWEYLRTQSAPIARNLVNLQIGQKDQLNYHSFRGLTPEFRHPMGGATSSLPVAVVTPKPETITYHSALPMVLAPGGG